MLGREYGYVNMILLMCNKSDKSNISNIFDTVCLEDENDKLSFNMVLFYDFYNCNENQINDLSIDFYLLKTNALGDKTGTNNTRKQPMKNRFICEHKFNIGQEKKVTKDDKSKFSCLVNGFGGRLIVELEDFDFAGFGDYEFLVFDSSTKLKDYMDDADNNLPLARRCIRVEPSSENV